MIEDSIRISDHKLKSIIRVTICLVQRPSKNLWRLLIKDCEESVTLPHITHQAYGKRSFLLRGAKWNVPFYSCYTCSHKPGCPLGSLAYVSTSWVCSNPVKIFEPLGKINVPLFFVHSQNHHRFNAADLCHSENKVLWTDVTADTLMSLDTERILRRVSSESKIIPSTLSYSKSCT